MCSPEAEIQKNLRAGYWIENSIIITIILLLLLYMLAYIQVLSQFQVTIFDE